LAELTRIITNCEVIMAHKRQHSAPVPPGNQSHSGPTDAKAPPVKQGKPEVASAQEQNPKKPIGDFVGKAEQSIQEPDGKNGANH
jgi:hypothetical protein